MKKQATSYPSPTQRHHLVQFYYTRRTVHGYVSLLCQPVIR